MGKVSGAPERHIQGVAEPYRQFIPPEAFGALAEYEHFGDGLWVIAQVSGHLPSVRMDPSFRACRVAGRVTFG